MLVLVTGVPGVGKTSVCAYLAGHFPDRYEHLPFGRLIAEALPEEPLEADLRRSPTQYVTRGALRRATTRLLGALSTSRSESRVTLLDSHAASQDDFGFVATPDGRTYFESVQYGAIVQLFASARTVLMRSDNVVSGRRAESEADLAMHFQIQTAISTLYSSLSECPAYFVSAEAPVVDVAARLDILLRGGGGDG